MKTKMKFMDVQILTRGQLPGLNRRGPIPSITLDTKTVIDLIDSGVEVCNLDGEKIYVKDVIADTAKEIADTIGKTATAFTQPEATLIFAEKEPDVLKAEVESGDTVVGEPVPGAAAMNEEIVPDVIANAAEVLTEKTDEAIAEATEPSAPETEDEKAEAAGEKLTPDGIPVFVPDPNMSKNQQKKARNAYYAKMRAERDAAAAAESK